MPSKRVLAVQVRNPDIGVEDTDTEERLGEVGKAGRWEEVPYGDVDRRSVR